MTSVCLLKRPPVSNILFPNHNNDGGGGVVKIPSAVKRPMIHSTKQNVENVHEIPLKLSRYSEKNRSTTTPIDSKPKKGSLVKVVAKKEVSSPMKKEIKHGLKKKPSKVLLPSNVEQYLCNVNNNRTTTTATTNNNNPRSSNNSNNAKFVLKDAPKMSIDQMRNIILNECRLLSGCSINKSTSMEDTLLIKKLRQLLQDDAFKNCSAVRQLLDILRHEKVATKEYLETCKLFSLNEVTKICNDGWKKKESQLKIYFDEQLKKLLNEQHTAFLKFQQETLSAYGVKPEYSSAPSYIS